VLCHSAKGDLKMLGIDSADDMKVFSSMNQAKGAGESMRGTKRGKDRPQLLVFDDILSDEILESEVQRKKLHTWFFSTVSNSVDITHFKYIMINNRYISFLNIN
jgi:hypothetical protein